MINRLNWSYFGKLKFYFGNWKVMLDKYKDVMEQRKYRVIDRLVYATLSGEKKALLKWNNFMWGERMRKYGDKVKAGHILWQLMKKEKQAEELRHKGLAFMRLAFDPQRLMKAILQKMVRSCAMDQNKAILLWKMQLYRSKAKIEEIKKSTRLNEMVAILHRKRNANLRAGFRALAHGVAFTKIQMKIFNKLNTCYFDKLGKFVFRWKVNVFHELHKKNAIDEAERESKKARMIDRMAYISMEGHKRAFLDWSRWTNKTKLIEHGNRIKASYIISLYYKKHKSEINDRYKRWAWGKLFYDQDAIIRHVMQKMARSCQMGINKAFLLWKLELRRSKEETAKIKRTLAARNVVNGFYRKYIRLARHGL